MSCGETQHQTLLFLFDLTRSSSCAAFTGRSASHKTAELPQTSLTLVFTSAVIPMLVGITPAARELREFGANWTCMLTAEASCCLPEFDLEPQRRHHNTHQTQHTPV